MTASAKIEVLTTYSSSLAFCAKPPTMSKWLPTRPREPLYPMPANTRGLRGLGALPNGDAGEDHRDGGYGGI